VWTFQVRVMISRRIMSSSCSSRTTSTSSALKVSLPSTGGWKSSVLPRDPRSTPRWLMESTKKSEKSTQKVIKINQKLQQSPDNRSTKPFRSVKSDLKKKNKVVKSDKKGGKIRISKKKKTVLLQFLYRKKNSILNVRQCPVAAINAEMCLRILYDFCFFFRWLFLITFYCEKFGINRGVSKCQKPLKTSNDKLSAANFRLQN